MSSAPSRLCAVVLAAGEGSRLRPLTTLRPKPLCPVGNTTQLDRTLDQLAAIGLAGPELVAVNACYLAGQIVDAVGPRARLSIESPPALGTAGGVAALSDWIDGRDVLVCNADGYRAPGDEALRLLLSGWERDRPRLLVVPDPQRGDFGTPRRIRRFAGASLAPWSLVSTLAAEPSELSVPWRRAEAAGRLELTGFDGIFIDCGTPADYLAANLHASGGDSVIASDATVYGALTRCVVWPGATVTADERLVDVVRATLPDGSPLTVPAGDARSYR